MAPATIVASENHGTLVLRPEGGWLVGAAAHLDRLLRALDPPPGRPILFDLGALDRVDTTGALLLLRAERELTASGHQVALVNLPPAFAPLFEQVRRHGAAPPMLHPVPAHHTLVGFVARIGEVTVGIARRGYSIIGFGGLVWVTLARLLSHPGRLRVAATFNQMEQAGLNALPIVGLLSFLIGVVMAYQGADQLRRFGAEIYTVNLLGVSILRELGVLLTAIIVAGRSGSAFTAHIGTMQINQEIDALRTIGLDPVEVLVVPRLIGLLLTMPLLALYADAMGLLGGCLMSWATLGITIPTFLDQLRGAVAQWTLWVGIIKAPFFAAIIGMVGCYEGFNVTGGAGSIGRLTTRSVVEAIFLVIVADAAFSIVFSLLGI